MNYFLIKFSADWSDEFQCERMTLAKSDATLEQMSERAFVSAAEGGYFGTNEGWEEDELDESVFEILEISETEYNTIEKLLGTDFGTGLSL